MAMDRRKFLQTSLAVSAVGSTAGSGMLHALAGAGAKREMLQAKGREIVEAGRPVRLRGVNLGGWMLIEDYMIGLPWTEWKIREQFKKILGEDSYSAFFNAFQR